MAKTNPVWVKEIKNGIITEEVLSAALYSVNKRAKNYRDNKRKYRSVWYWNETLRKSIENCEEQMEKYYHMKDVMLSVLLPIKVHENEYGEWFLVYKTAYGCYHKPINEADIPNVRFKVRGNGNSNGEFTPTVQKVRLNTTGADIHDLVSAQFATKV